MMPKHLVSILCLLLLIGAFTRCKKSETENLVSVRDSLLGNWSRVIRAYDYNNNQQLDSSEILQAPATDTFVFSLANDASYQRIQTFKGVKFLVYGTWHLQHTDSELVLQPTTSTSLVDTFRLDIITQSYFRYHTIDTNAVWYWEAFERPR